MSSKEDKEKKFGIKLSASVIAGLVTFVCALIILLLLFILGLRADREALAESSMPEIQDVEEYYLEPDLIVDDNPGDENAEQIDNPAPQPLGEPDPAEVEQPVKTVVAKEEPKEKPKAADKNITTKKESPVKAAEPKPTAEEEKRLANVKGKFKSDNNGSSTGKDAATSGSGGDGVSASGNLNGRKMLNCSSWKVRLAQKTTVVVDVTVDAGGKTLSAVARKGAGTANLRKECEKMALTSTWTPKKGAPTAKGTITFTIVPR